MWQKETERKKKKKNTRRHKNIHCNFLRKSLRANEVWPFLKGLPFVPTWFLIAQIHGKGSSYIPCGKYMHLTWKYPKR